MTYALLLVLALAQPRQQKPPAQTKQAISQQRGSPESPVFVKAIPGEPSKQARDAERAHAENEKRIADGTIALAILTGLLFLATGILACFTWKLWRDTKRLADDAGKAAETQAGLTREAIRHAEANTAAAQNTVRIMEQSAERQLRAYLSIGGSGIWPDEYGTSGRLWVDVENTGQTPAYNLTSKVGKLLIPKAECDSFEFPEAVPQAGGSVMVGSGCDITLRREFSIAEAKAVKDRTHRLYLFGRIEYTDAFGQSRFTNYRLYWWDGRMNVENLSRTPHGNDGN